jgi:26S proteasome regulatory subunit T3
MLKYVFHGLDITTSNVSAKVIMATNRADTLDPALLRPGRLDRKIEFPLPSRREKRLIFQTVTSKMNLGPDVDLEDCKFNFRPTPAPAIEQFHRCFATRSAVVGRNRLHCPSRWPARSVNSIGTMQRVI